TCSETICMPPRTFAIPMTFLGAKPVEIEIAAGTSTDTAQNKSETLQTDSNKTLGAAPSPSATQQSGVNGQGGATSQSDGTGKIQSTNVIAIADTSIWQFILAAIGFGLLALLTPCVFPMVPITVSFFMKRNAGSKKAALKDASLYALGIILTFVALGFVLSRVAGAAGINKFAANPWGNLIIALVFVAFALNLFGLFEIGLPSSLLTKLNSTAQQSKSRTFSVMLMGLLFSLTSFTCTVPFVGTLMV